MAVSVSFIPVSGISFLSNFITCKFYVIYSVWHDHTHVSDPSVTHQSLHAA